MLLAWALLMFRVGGAWLGHQDANGAWISTAVMNYVRHGFIPLGGMVVLNPTAEMFNGASYYVSHPPIAVWLPYPLIALAGYDESLMRIIYAGATLISAAGVATFSRRLFKGSANWTMAFFLFTPMMLYFGRMPDHEAPALAFLMVFAIALADWLNQPTSRRFALCAVLMILIAWAAWGGLITAIMTGLVTLIAYRQRWRSLLGLVVIGGIAGALVILYYQLRWSGAVQDLLDHFLWRTSSATFGEGSVSFTLIEYITRISLRFLTLFTPTVMILAVIGVFLLRRADRRAAALVVGLLLGALAFILVFRNASFVHDYYLIYFAPSLALLAGSAAAYAFSAAGKRQRSTRLLRPLVVALVVCLPLINITYLRQLYEGSTDPTSLVFAEALAQHTPPDALIYSNLPTVGLATELYSERAVRWSSAPPENTSAYYLYCGERTQLEALNPQTTYDVLDGCWLAQLQ
jgi:4-amino-4-deoxy-L-arabinose transferase-like glycosyltransferase